MAHFQIDVHILVRCVVDLRDLCGRFFLNTFWLYEGGENHFVVGLQAASTRSDLFDLGIRVIFEFRAKKLKCSYRLHAAERVVSRFRVIIDQLDLGVIVGAGATRFGRLFGFFRGYIRIDSPLNYDHGLHHR